MSVEHLTDSNFKDVIAKADKPVLVDFFATWCGPCKMVAPILEEIATETEDFIVYKVDVDESPESAKEFGVVNIPTFISFENGEVKNKNVGALPKDGILDFMK